MRKLALIVAAAVIVVTIVVLAVWPGEREPQYQGKKLSEWLDKYYLHPAGTAEAVRGIGPEKAVPFLVKWIPYRAARWRQRVSAIGDEGCDCDRNEFDRKQLLPLRL